MRKLSRIDLDKQHPVFVAELLEQRHERVMVMDGLLILRGLDRRRHAFKLIQHLTHFIRRMHAVHRMPSVEIALGVRVGMITIRTLAEGLY